MRYGFFCMRNTRRRTLQRNEWRQTGDSWVIFTVWLFTLSRVYYFAIFYNDVVKDPVYQKFYQFIGFFMGVAFCCVF